MLQDLSLVTFLIMIFFMLLPSIVFIVWDFGNKICIFLRYIAYDPNKIKKRTIIDLNKIWILDFIKFLNTIETSFGSKKCPIFDIEWTDHKIYTVTGFHQYVVQYDCISCMLKIYLQDELSICLNLEKHKDLTNKLSSLLQKLERLFNCKKYVTLKGL